jgi:hypothetical protein
MKNPNIANINENLMSNYSLKRFIAKTLRLDPVLQHYRLKAMLPSYLYRVAVGLLLSDGSIERPSKSGGARLSVNLGLVNLPYLMHLFVLFDPYLGHDFSILDVKDKNR